MEDRPDSPDQEPVERREEDRAAAEAGSIGGEAAEEGADPAERPVAEGGGGVAEGFERAEHELLDEAEHGEGGAEPRGDAFPTEQESGATGAAYGEADGRESTETPDRRAERDAERRETDPREPDPEPRPPESR